MTRRALAALLSFVVCLLFASGARAAVVINEIDYDQPGTDTGEFIELLNTGSSPVSLDGYTIQLVNGANNSIYKTITTIPTGITLGPGQYYVICGDDTVVPGCQLDVSPNSDLIQNGSPDALSLLLNGTVVDSLSYEGDVPGNTEGTGVSTANAENNNSPNLSLSRCPNGNDSNNNSLDFKTAAPTPGGSNNCGAGGGTVGLCGDPSTRIAAVQGNGASSPIIGSGVNIEGVVVADYQSDNLNGFFVQERDSLTDGNLATSEGIFVYQGANTVAVSVGQLVRVRGTVGEQNGLTELSSVTDVIVCNGSATASPTSLSFPVNAVSDLERYEGMWVQVPQTLTVSGNFAWGRYGSLDMSASGRLYQPTNRVAPGSAALALQDLNSRNRILLDDLSNAQDPSPIPYKDANNTRRLGDTVSGLSGILSGQFNEYRIHPIASVAFSSGGPRPASPAAVGGRLRVASMNVLNFFTTLDVGTPICGPTGGLDCRGANNAAEFDRQRTKLLNALQALNADIVGLMEVENNSSAAAQSLVDGLNTRLGAGSYGFINTGTIGTDAIKVALIFKTAKVTPQGAPAILTSAVNPLFVDTKNRPALAQTFDEVATGGRLTVIVNHLKSKGSDCNDIGDPDANDGQGNCNVTRTRAASALKSWLSTDPTHSSDPDFLLIGDFNAYAKEDPITTLKTSFTSLIETFVGPDAYSYQFDAQSGYLDSAFASSSLAAQVTGVSEWHINSDEPVVENYNTEFKVDDPFNPADPFGASDHDPILIGLNLSTASAAPALDPRHVLLAGALLLALGAWRMRRQRAVV
jgi:uncharacterized protein